MSSIIKSALIFTIGFLTCLIMVYSLLYINVEIPLSITGLSVNHNNGTAPSNWLKENQIQVYDDRVVIKISNSSLSRYASTGSMKPVFDENSNGLRIKPQNENQLNIGDIVTYQLNDELIVHRIIEKGIDENGTYFIVKGDNNSVSDGKIRFSQIKYVTVAILW